MTASAHTVARKLRLTDRYGNASILTFILGFAAFVALIVAIVMVSVIVGGRVVGRTTCRNWGVQTGIPTKFAILNWNDPGTCLARTPDGRWVLNTNWQAFVNGGGKP